MKKEIPILFSTPMVQALIAGTKTQTRRIINPQPIVDEGSGYVFFKNDDGIIDIHNWQEKLLDECKYQVGDLLWVRETTSKFPVNGVIVYKAGLLNYKFAPGQGETIIWKPSIFMLKESCRIWLEVVSVKIEKLKEISQEDAEAEGVQTMPHRCEGWKNKLNQVRDCFKCSYKFLWNKINGKGDYHWNNNPWVWAIEFKQIKK